MMLAWLSSSLMTASSGPQKGLEEPCIGIETGRVQDRILCAQKLGYALFQDLVDVLGATNKSDGGHTKTVGLHSLPHRSQHLGMVRQPQIIIGAEIDARPSGVSTSDPWGVLISFSSLNRPPSRMPCSSSSSHDFILVYGTISLTSLAMQQHPPNLTAE